MRSLVFAPAREDPQAVPVDDRADKKRPAEADLPQATCTAARAAAAAVPPLAFKF